jgi:H/ACA ribonucleoprotein complex subunit 2
MGKEKKQEKMDVDSPKKTDDVQEVPYEERIRSLSKIAHPLASKKLTKKLLKVVKKGTRL